MIGYCDEVVVWWKVEVMVIPERRAASTVVWESTVWMEHLT